MFLQCNVLYSKRFIFKPVAVLKNYKWCDAIEPNNTILRRWTDLIFHSLTLMNIPWTKRTYKQKITTYTKHCLAGYIFLCVGHYIINILSWFCAVHRGVPVNRYSNYLVVIILSSRFMDIDDSYYAWNLDEKNSKYV